MRASSAQKSVWREYLTTHSRRRVAVPEKIRSEMTSVSASRPVASVAARERSCSCSWSSSRGRRLLHASASSSLLSSSSSSSSTTFSPTSSSTLTSLGSSLYPRQRLRSRSRRRPELVVPVAAGDGSSSSADAEAEAEDAHPFPLSEVTRAVLEFHSSEGNGNAESRVRDDGTTARGGEKTVPLESWARRYGWEPSFAEQILWQSDCPLRGGIRGGEPKPEGRERRGAPGRGRFMRGRRWCSFSFLFFSSFFCSHI